MTATPDHDPARVFDRALIRRRRNRAAAWFARCDFLHREVGARMIDRLADVNRRFPVALNLACNDGALAAELQAAAGADMLIAADMAEAMAQSMARRTPATAPVVVADEEFLPFADGSLDLVFSCLGLHWVNDLPGALAQARRALKPDGLLLAALPGGRTLHELRDVLLAAEGEVMGGASPRVSPFVDLRDAGALLQRAGFALPVVDADAIPVTYENMFALMADLRAMGWANAVAARLRRFTPRAVFLRAAELYQQRWPAEDGVTATFEIIHLHAWAPAPSQPQPLRPGTGRTPLAEALRGDAQT